MSKFELLKAKFLNPQNTSEGFKCTCPLHDDKEPSLWISEKDGFPVGHCKANCDNKQVNKYIYFKAIEIGYEKRASKTPINIYQYRDIEGENTYQKYKFEKGSKPPYLIKPKGAKLHLYNLHLVPDADTVFIAEGEGDADTLTSYGLVGISAPNGASSWRDEYKEYLKGKEVYIIPDNDKAGICYARDILRSIPDAKLIGLPFPNFGDKINKDVSDYLTNHTFEQLTELFKTPITFDEFASRANTSTPETSITELDSISFDQKLLDMGRNDSFDLAFLKKYEAEAEKRKGKKKRPYISESFFRDCPGIVGKIAKWINDTSQYPQPMLALGAALSIVGLVKSHRVQTDTGLRTNIFALGIGESGCGKDYSRKCIKKILKECQLRDLEAGGCTGDSALFRILAERKGRALLNLDEMGIILKGVTDQKSASSEKKLLGALLTIWSSANDSFIGKEYADNKTNKTHMIEQPSLSIWGVTTPSTLYEALNSGHAADGFLPRWLVFPVENPDVEYRDIGDLVLGDVPSEIIEKLVEINQMPTNCNPQGNIDQHIEIRPAIIPFSSAAQKMKREIMDAFNKKKIEEREKNTGLDAVWTRGLEHTLKLALTVSDGEEIGTEEMLWAYTFVLESLTCSCQMFTMHAHEDIISKRADQVLDFIRQKGKVTRTILCRKFRWLNAGKRCITEDLIETSEIIKVEYKGPTGHQVIEYLIAAE
jgi:hypothetical protein